MRFASRVLPRSDGAIAALLASAAVLLYELSVIGPANPFDYHGELARAFLAGRWWLTEPPARLDELVPCGPNRFCVAYPLAPAIFALPFVLALPPWTAQTIASAIVGGLSAAPMYLALRALGVRRSAAVLVTVFAIAGTTLWFTSAYGGAWGYAHALAVLFSSLAVLAAVRGWPPWSVGALIGTAALARLPLFLAIPPLALLVRQRRGGAIASAFALTLLGAAPFAFAELAYNLARWGVPTEAGYGYLSVNNPVAPLGLFDLRYVPDHLFAIFLRPPALGEPPFPLRPTHWGVSLMLISPAYLFLAAAVTKLRADPIFVTLLAAGGLAIVPDLLHGGVGAKQFGYRFSLDAQPFLLPLVALGASWKDGWQGGSGWLLAAVAWSVLANLYGVLVVGSLGYA